MKTALLFGLVGAGLSALADNDACSNIGCEPDVQVVYGTTYITDTVTSGPPFPDPSGFPGAEVVNANAQNPNAIKVTYAVSNPTTVVVPRKTPAIDGSPATSWVISTSYITHGDLTYATPYLAAVTTPACPTPQTTTVTLPPLTTTETVTPPPVTQISTLTLPPVTTTQTDTSTTTSYITSTSTSVSVSTVTSTTTEPAKTITETSTSVSLVTLPPVTSTTTETSVQVQWSTSTTTSTVTSTTTSVSFAPVSTTTSTVTSTSYSVSTTTYCPPPVTSDAPPPVTSDAPPPVTSDPPTPCENRVFRKWKVFSINKNSAGVPQPATFTETIPAAAYLTIVDSDYLVDRYTVYVDGVLVGLTSDITKNADTYCSKGDDCLAKGYSNGKYLLTAGTHTIKVEGFNLDLGYKYYGGQYKIEEKCD